MRSVGDDQVPQATSSGRTLPIVPDGQFTHGTGAKHLGVP